ncbi:MAG: hypothetical protein PUK25_05995 [Clostridiales bacterium]|nr:hypothetical protein [Clostridiales bacterium]MDY5702999.1 hypothetical protein [Eubacteriales bacterium]
MRSVSNTTKLALAAMSTALSVLFLYAASILNTSRLALLFLTSLLLWIPLNEKKGFFYAFLSYAATALLSFLIIPDKSFCAAYASVFGAYCFIKFVCDKIPSKLFAFLIKLIGCNLLAGILLLVAVFLMNMDIIALIDSYAVEYWVVVLIAEAAFSAFILLYDFLARVFDKELRRKLVNRN